MLDPSSNPTPCPLTETRRWHQHHAARHRAKLPAADSGEPAAPDESVSDESAPEPISARAAWHRGWAEYHEQQVAATNEKKPPA